jgi:cobalamin synthase
MRAADLTDRCAGDSGARVAWVDELCAAVGTGTRWRSLASGHSLADRVGGLAFLPIVGGLVGAAAAATSAVAASMPLAAALVAVLMLEGLAGRRASGAAAAVAALKVAALATIPAVARTVVLVLAAALGRWAVVVQCYGGRPASGADASPLVGRARFREFGIASVTAIGGALVALDAIGLLSVVTSALVTVALRTLAYRRSGGLGVDALDWTETVVEATTLVVVAVVATLLRRIH